MGKYTVWCLLRFGDGSEGDGLTFTSGSGSSPVSMTECSRIFGYKLYLGVQCLPRGGPASVEGLYILMIKFRKTF